MIKSNFFPKPTTNEMRMNYESHPQFMRNASVLVLGNRDTNDDEFFNKE